MTISTTTRGYPSAPFAHYGSGVWPLGEDGDYGVMVEGHGLRALAAYNAHQREMCGTHWRVTEMLAFKPREARVRFHETCGCTSEQHAAHRAEERDCECEHWGLPPCIEGVFDFAWTEHDDQDAFPVTVIRW